MKQLESIQTERNNETWVDREHNTFPKSHNSAYLKGALGHAPRPELQGPAVVCLSAIDKKLT